MYSLFINMDAPSMEAPINIDVILFYIYTYRKFQFINFHSTAKPRIIVSRAARANTACAYLANFTYNQSPIEIKYPFEFRK